MIAGQSEKLQIYLCIYINKAVLYFCLSGSNISLQRWPKVSLMFHLFVWLKSPTSLHQGWPTCRHDKHFQWLCSHWLVSHIQRLYFGRCNFQSGQKCTEKC